MVSEEWYGSHRDEPLSPRVQSLRAILDILKDEDFNRLEDLANRLATNETMTSSAA